MLLVLICNGLYAFTETDSLQSKYKYISKKKLVLMIDSVLDLENISTAEVNQLNYLISILGTSKT